MPAEEFDTIVIGAGVAGIGSAAGVGVDADHFAGRLENHRRARVAAGRVHLILQL